MTRAIRLLILASLATLTACYGDHQPPRPYAAMPREAHLLDAIVNQPGVEIAPPEGVSPELGMPVAKALAEALQEADVPAVAGQSLAGAHRLTGTARLENGAIIIAWRLHDPKGAELKIVEVRDAVSKQLSTGAPLPQTVLQALTAQAVSGLVPQFQATAIPHGENLRVFVPDIAGLPGDGGKSLPFALRRALGAVGMSVAATEEPRAIRIIGRVIVSDMDAATQQVMLNWRVLGADGVEIGVVDQSNRVPRGRLDGNWGDIAYAAARGAAEGVVPLLQDHQSRLAVQNQVKPAP